MSDIGDPAIALMVNGGLIGAAPLQIVVPEKFHVLALRLALSDRGDGCVSGKKNSQHKKYSPCIPRANFSKHVSSHFESAANCGWMRASIRTPN